MTERRTHPNQTFALQILWNAFRLLDNCCFWKHLQVIKRHSHTVQHYTQDCCNCLGCRTDSINFTHEDSLDWFSLELRETKRCDVHPDKTRKKLTTCMKYTSDSSCYRQAFHTNSLSGMCVVWRERANI